MPRSLTNKKILLVAVLVALTCSAFVTVSTIVLRPVQEENKQHYMMRNMLSVAGLLQDGVQLEEQLDQLQPRLVDLNSGKFIASENPEIFDQRKAIKDPQKSIKLNAEQDIAGIKRRANQALVYLVYDEDHRIDKIILPVYGYGLWSTLYGFVALEKDVNTIKGIGFYEHKETPGLGGEVDNSRWLAQWQGKQIFNEQWQPTIKLVKGGVNHHDPQTIHQIDALSGATLTSHGVENLLQFWLGDLGYAPFLSNLREGSV